MARPGFQSAAVVIRWRGITLHIAESAFCIRKVLLGDNGWSFISGNWHSKGIEPKKCCGVSEAEINPVRTVGLVHAPAGMFAFG